MGQKITMVPVNTIILSTKFFAQGRHDVEASSSGGKLMGRQRKRRNIELQAQQLSPELFVT